MEMAFDVGFFSEQTLQSVIKRILEWKYLFRMARNFLAVLVLFLLLPCNSAKIKYIDVFKIFIIKKIDIPIYILNMYLLYLLENDIWKDPNIKYTDRTWITIKKNSVLFVRCWFCCYIIKKIIIINPIKKYIYLYQPVTNIATCSTIQSTYIYICQVQDFIFFIVYYIL